MKMSPALRLAAIVAFALVAMSCPPHHHDHDSQAQNSNSNTATNENTGGAAESGPGLRAACADEIQKYCAADTHVRRCLRDNMDKLGDTCKTAVNTRRNAGNGRRQGIGRVCAEELAKFCANDDRKFRCLKNNLGQLGDACKALVTAPREPRQGGGQNDNP